ncbi:hypothetical protein LUZ60_008323 [Juncus effusus]|nr:hypothetical protein LUZ60_008323 [Juncus effusus]
MFTLSYMSNFYIYLGTKYRLHFMSYTVTKSSPVQVPPATSTPQGLLPLSSIDRASAPTVYVDFISVFPQGDRPAERIKAAFAEALVYYYPVAGRVSEGEGGEAVVNCTGQGIWYIEAKANCSLADVNHLERPLMIPKEEILPRHPSIKKLEELILTAQVTEFTCGGFTVGISFSHLVFDGQGAAQFLKSVGEIARNLPEPTIKPVWSRELIPNPKPKSPLNAPSLPDSLTSFNFVTLNVTISNERVNNVKERFTSQTGKNCSSFDVVTALVYKSRAKAIDLALNADVRIGFTTSTRHLLKDVLDNVEGYYGNCIYISWVIKKREEIINASLVDVITIVREAKENLKGEFLNWMSGGTGMNYSVPLDYGTVTVADWRWVGFNEVDYGWGEPTYVFQVNDDYDFLGFGIYLRPLAPQQGIKLMLRCVEEKHASEFVSELERF